MYSMIKLLVIYVAMMGLTELIVLRLRTTNSLIFPHYHVICDGLWNFKKYPTLKVLLETFDIDTTTRGVHTWWELYCQ